MSRGERAKKARRRPAAAVPSLQPALRQIGRPRGAGKVRQAVFSKGVPLGAGFRIGSVPAGTNGVLRMHLLSFPRGASASGMMRRAVRCSAGGFRKESGCLPNRRFPAFGKAFRVPARIQAGWLRFAFARGILPCPIAQPPGLPLRQGEGQPAGKAAGRNPRTFSRSAPSSDVPRTLFARCASRTSAAPPGEKISAPQAPHLRPLLFARRPLPPVQQEPGKTKKCREGFLLRGKSCSAALRPLGAPVWDAGLQHSQGRRASSIPRRCQYDRSAGFQPGRRANL